MTDRGVRRDDVGKIWRVRRMKSSRATSSRPYHRAGPRRHTASMFADYDLAQPTYVSRLRRSVIVPTTNATAATDISGTKATLNGSVNPESITAPNASSNTGRPSPTAKPPLANRARFRQHRNPPGERDVSDLDPRTAPIYHLRLVAENCQRHRTQRRQDARDRRHGRNRSRRRDHHHDRHPSRTRAPRRRTVFDLLLRTGARPPAQLRRNHRATLRPPKSNPTSRNTPSACRSPASTQTTPTSCGSPRPARKARSRAKLSPSPRPVRRRSPTSAPGTQRKARPCSKPT